MATTFGSGGINRFDGPGNTVLLQATAERFCDLADVLRRRGEDEARLSCLRLPIDYDPKHPVVLHFTPTIAARVVEVAGEGGQ